ncbi:Oidioi.mRNA.OKI2018_I69.PAR.g10859.t1.cds [Oikopleura dioica]|uniref:Oidioi.mRNA.OKI2018_I69.PAR.g10859.t1.cds n=1 Tax=Oikopleura dioica TaxID=34765 RepID=A0ABN7RSU4_OIKDI|nr:Oidioi.mRNA.OKI2018_I69.PAR.g10859.t1.cds [Oikopleura dioica]
MDVLVSLMDKIAVYLAQQIQRIHHEAAQAEEMSCFQQCITAGFPRSRKISPKRRKEEKSEHHFHPPSPSNQGRRLSENYPYHSAAESYHNYPQSNIHPPRRSSDGESLMNSFNGSLHSSFGRKFPPLAPRKIFSRKESPVTVIDGSSTRRAIQEWQQPPKYSTYQSVGTGYLKRATMTFFKRTFRTSKNLIISSIKKDLVWI